MWLEKKDVQAEQGLESTNSTSAVLKQKIKLACVATHPIQYQTPFYKKISSSENIDLTVLFCSNWGLKGYKDEGFGKEVSWDIPLLDGYNYKFLHNFSLTPNVSKFWGLINFGVIPLIASKKFDAIWVHGWARLTDWLVILTAILFKVPILLRGESTLLLYTPPWKLFLKKLVLCWLFKKVEAFLTIGAYNKQFYEHYGVPKEKIFLVPYAVNSDFFITKANELKPKRLILKEKYGIPKELPVVIYSGKLIQAKRPMDLLEAFYMATKKREAALMFMGDGILKNMLEKYVKEKNLKNIYFMGFRNQTELPEFYATADIFVLPSEHEPWGLVVNEAMCFGLPVIVSDKVGASGDLVKENGFIYPASDVNALAQHLEFLLLNATKREEMGMKSKEIISKWTYKEGVEGLLHCLMSIKQEK